VPAKSLTAGVLVNQTLTASTTPSAASMDAGTHATTLGATALLLETTTLATPTTAGAATQATMAIALITTSTTTQATMATASTTTQATMVTVSTIHLLKAVDATEMDVEEAAAGTVDPLMAIAGVEVATVAAVVETTTKEVENRLLFGHRALHSLGEGDVKTDHSLFFPH